MILALLLAATSPLPFETNGDGSVRAVPAQTAVDAERAFAADAQSLGQWTAFRKWAASDAIMFLPQPANVRATLKDWRDPPRSVEWSPAESYVSCDGKLAVNTGPWRQPDGSVGYFTTIWVKQRDGGWRWIVDSGDAKPVERFVWGAKPVVYRASCKHVRSTAPVEYGAGDPRSDDGASPDGSVAWSWAVNERGGRTITVATWEGHNWGVAVLDTIPPPKPTPTP